MADRLAEQIQTLLLSLVLLKLIMGHTLVLLPMIMVMTVQMLQ